MHQLNEFLQKIDSYIGSSAWFVYVLLGVGLFFTLYLKFPQIRYFKHAIRVVKGKYDKKNDQGDTSHFQALTTALSGTVGTGNIAGVALAIHMGGPSALFWMLVTAMLGMTTKFVEVTLSHKYREKTKDGTMAGGPMYYMKHANFKLGNKKINFMPVAIIFAVATIFSSFGTGNLPQIISIADSVKTSFGINHIITGAVLAVLLALVIVGGIKRIAGVTSKLVPIMAIFYFIGAIAVIVYNYDNIIPSIGAIFGDVFTGTAATGGFLGAGFAFAFNRGVNRGLFSNEAGQGSAPIAHASAKAHEPVSEGMVAILEPFIDTIVICFLTGLVILSSGVWNEKIQNEFDLTDITMVEGTYHENKTTDIELLNKYIHKKDSALLVSGMITIEKGMLPEDVTMLYSRSIAEDVLFSKNNESFSGNIMVTKGKLEIPEEVTLSGKSLLHSAPLTTEAFTKSFLGEFGKYIVTIGLLLFAFSTAISWSYYGDRAMTFLFGTKSVVYYRIIYVLGFFSATFLDTKVIWTFSGITIALMTLPNLVGIFWLRKEMKSTVDEYWQDFNQEFPEEANVEKY